MICLLESPSAKGRQALEDGEENVSKVVEDWMDSCLKIIRHQWETDRVYIQEVNPRARVGWGRPWVTAIMAYGGRWIEREGKAWMTNCEEVQSIIEEEGITDSQEIAEVASEVLNDKLERRDAAGRPNGPGEEPSRWTEF